MNFRGDGGPSVRLRAAGCSSLCSFDSSKASCVTCCTYLRATDSYAPIMIDSNADANKWHREFAYHFIYEHAQFHSLLQVLSGTWGYNILVHGIATTRVGMTCDESGKR